VNRTFYRRRSVRAAVFVLCLGAAAAPPSASAGNLLHARLLSSAPAADARLTRAPELIRLVFSEAIIADLSQIALTGPDGITVNLPVSLDRGERHILIGTVGPLSTGVYRVVWNIVSADGHPVAGNFAFSLVVGTVDSALFPPIIPEALSPPATTPDSIALPSPTLSEDQPIPKAASLLRGLGVGAMMAGIGLLFFGSAAGSRRHLNPGSVVTRFLALGALLLAAHMGAWLYNISPGSGLSRVFSASAVTSTPGMIESARVLLAVFSLWTIAMGQRWLGLVLGVACLSVSGAVGHSAAINPTWAVPAKIIHLNAAAVWLGGLLWLGWTFRRDITAFRIEARRVSSAALIAMIAVAGSGVTQALLFLDWPQDLLYSDYGRLVSAKISGLLILILLGAYNRFSLVPQLDDSRKGRKLSRSVSQELLVMLAILVISGFLANVPPPARGVSSGGIESVTR
jgi:putative copper export protein/methionine-rich copper-binding protein CopC